MSDTETYCCGFGARASCIARGLDYSGPDTPCEVRLVESDGETTCEGLSGSSGYVEDCDCIGEGTHINAGGLGYGCVCEGQAVRWRGLFQGGRALWILLVPLF